MSNDKPSDSIQKITSRPELRGDSFQFGFFGGIVFNLAWFFFARAVQSAMPCTGYITGCAIQSFVYLFGSLALADLAIVIVLMLLWRRRMAGGFVTAVLTAVSTLVLLVMGLLGLSGLS